MGMLLPAHVWLCVTGRWAQDARPGILTEWRQTPKPDQRWEGYVIAAASHSIGTGSKVTVEQGWHRREHIEPADNAQASLPGTAAGGS